jgi:transcriptional regulator GlxA family with amidase domain
MTRSVGVLLFPDFELLDVFGPLETLGLLENEFSIRVVAESAEIASAQGPRSLADDRLADRRRYDIVLVPGGMGTRREVENETLRHWLIETAGNAEIVASVCTGSALLARAGLLDGRRATSNKRAFDWVMTQGPKVEWQRRARWVEDGKFFTASGVSAGMDMALALIARLYGRDRAREVAGWAEYVWNEDSTNDPFAR